MYERRRNLAALAMAVMMVFTTGFTRAAATSPAAGESADMMLQGVQQQGEMKLAELVRVAAEVSEVLSGREETGAGVLLSVGYLSGAGVQLGIEFAVASLASLGGGQASTAADPARRQLSQVRREAEAGARVLELLAQAACFSEVGDWKSCAECQAQAAAALGRMPGESAMPKVNRRDLEAVIAAVEAMPIEHVLAAWVGGVAEPVDGGGHALSGGAAPAWLSAVADGTVRVDLAWPVADARPQVGVSLMVRLGGSARPSGELAASAGIAAAQLELAGLLSQFSEANHSCSFHAGAADGCDAVLLARAAAALRILGGMGIGV